jgi:hypothetical protein
MVLRQRNVRGPRIGRHRCSGCRGTRGSHRLILRAGCVAHGRPSVACRRRGCIRHVRGGPSSSLRDRKNELDARHGQRRDRSGSSKVAARRWLCQCRPPFRRIKVVGEVLRLVDHRSIREHHDAQGVAGRTPSYVMTLSLTHRSPPPRIRRTVKCRLAGCAPCCAEIISRPRNRSPDCGSSRIASALSMACATSEAPRSDACQCSWPSVTQAERPDIWAFIGLAGSGMSATDMLSSLRAES